MKKPRNMRELEALPIEEATQYWNSLSDEEKIRLANAMTAEDIAAIPQSVKNSMRSLTAHSLQTALGELESAQTTDGRFVFTGDGDSFELTEEYCTHRLADLTSKIENQTEESLGFYGYHNLRIWIEAYTVLLNEYHKRDKG